MNLKAVSSMTADFLNGCTAIITGGNDRGKTSFIRALMDRIKGTKPDLILKRDEQEGFAKYTMTDGCRFEWTFNDKGKEKLVFITADNIKTAATREICDRYFPGSFDVDKFLLAQPAAQRKMLQILAGVDFTDVDGRYKVAYDIRTNANRLRDEANVRFDAVVVPALVEAVDAAALLLDKEQIRKQLNDQYLLNKGNNDKARNEWIAECEKVRNEVNSFNTKQQAKKTIIEIEEKIHQKVNDILAVHPWFKDAVNFGHIADYLKNLDQPEPVKVYVAPPDPAYIQELPDNTPLLSIDEKINAANETNRQAQLYKDWLIQKDNLTDLTKKATEANEAVGKIEQERINLIKSAKMPEGFSFSEDGLGIEYRNLPFTREQQSSSGIVIAALKLASMTLGEVKTLCFDASYLDGDNIAKVEAWAVEQGLQLLIEIPSREGGDIRYEIVQDVQ